MKLKSIIITILLLAVSAEYSYSQEKFRDIEDIGMNYTGNITAPDFPQGAEWLNTDKPLSIKDFKGKLVLLDFWTFCCINCMHIIPDLKKLEEKYHSELVVIGVHSAKFLTEQGTENIRNAILRYGLEHPVINDKDFIVWNEYTASAWPTLVLIDPNGKVIGTSTGEGVYDLFDPVISSAISYYDANGPALDRTPVKFALEKNKEPKSLLNYPGKITADATGSRLFVTDSDNNRILVLKPDSDGSKVEIQDVIGSGRQGSKDGSYANAEFFHPQGIAFSADKLYVADTENHLIRVIDLATKQVKTIAGLGYQSKEFGYVSGKADEVALNSPWDLVVIGDKLYIAMAGSHQLWVMNLSTNEIGVYAGSGNENIVDGTFEKSALAQPSGITTGNGLLYFADSEVSGVRSADLSSGGRVRTIVGSGLFDFGDIDGKGTRARLQHPIGITYNPQDNLLYVADTYNNKIKIVNPETKEAKTYSGSGLEGNRDGISDAQFNEPNGLVIVNGKIYVTDTNNHLIRVIDMQTKEVKTVVITNPEKLMANVKQDKKRVINAIKLDGVGLKSGDTKLKFNFSLPEGYHINPDAMPEVSASSDDNVIDAVEKDINTASPMFEVPVKVNGKSGKINLEVLIYYCDTENAGICKFRDLYFEIPVNISSAGKDEVEISYMLN